MKIHDLQKIENIREILPREDSHFTPWIAENLYKINNLLGLELELLEQEASCGRYRLDIKAKNLPDDSIVVIENQYEYTDHDHLGKLITYASGFDANYMIWITENYNEEHRAAIDWLNEISHENISFFLLQVELVRINNSEDVASNFKVICQPNSWSKTIKDRMSRDYSEQGLFFLDFWSGVKEFAIENKYAIANKLGKATAKPYNGVSIQSPLCKLLLGATSSKVYVSLYIHSDDGLFRYLSSYQDVINSELECSLIFDESPDKKKFEITLESDKYNANASDVRTSKWLLDNLEKMYNTLPKYVREYENK